MTNKQDLTEKFNELDYRFHPDSKWFSRVLNLLFFGGVLLSIVVIFFILITESGRSFSNNPVLRGFILDTFPNAQLWIYSTIKYKQEIVLIYFYYVLLLFFSGVIMVYLFIFNWRRMVTYQKLVFAKNQGKSVQLCSFKVMVKFILGLALFSGLIFVFGFLLFEPSLTPMVYDDYDRSSRKNSLYHMWNSYPGLVIMFFVKFHVILPLILLIPFSIISMLMCFKRNRFYSPK